MDAITQDTYGNADVLKLERVPKPEIGKQEILIRVCAAGVDRGVWHLMTGLPYLIRVIGFGFRGPKVRTPGLDVSGRVETVGEEVTEFKAGDDVFGVCEGTFAEYTKTTADKLVLKPSNLSHEEAAAVPVSACTALEGLRDIGELKPGQKVLILGASGGVGSFAVQLAKSMGAEVTGVCSTAKLDMLRSLGADHVIDYTRDDFSQSGVAYDLILDIGGNSSLSKLRRSLSKSGILVIVGGEEGDRWIGGTDRQMRAMLLSPFVRQKLRTFVSAAPKKDILHLKELIEAGQLKPHIDRTFPLSEAPEALRYLAAGKVMGKVVIRVSEGSA